MSRGVDETIYAFRRNVVVVASAGTGKTFQLATLYTLLLLGLTSMGERDDESAAPHLRPDRIAATTFSRAAAAEIRGRVEQILHAIATDAFPKNLDPYRRILSDRAARTGQPPIDSPVMRERARSALADLSSALIDTLHGLAASIIRASAWEIGIAANFSIVDDDDAAKDLGFAVDEALTFALETNAPAAVDLLGAAGGLGRARDQIARLLERLDDDGIPATELDTGDLEADALRLVNDLSAHARALASEGGRRAAAAEIALHALAAFADGEAVAEASRQARTQELKMALTPLFEGRSKSDADVALREWLNASFRSWTRIQSADRVAHFVVHARELNRAIQGARAIIADAAQRLERIRRGRGRLGFGDVLRIARDAVRDDPRVAARARASFDVLLIDELQDTSRVQRDLIYLLRETSEAAGQRPARTLPQASDLEPRGLLVVGDRKQSIYAFRGADVGVFTRVCVELAGEQASSALDLGQTSHARQVADLVVLAENRRSHASILAFINQFATRDFEPDSAPHPDDIHYAAAEHLAPPAPVPAPAAERGREREHEREGELAETRSASDARPNTQGESRVVIVRDDVASGASLAGRSNDLRLSAGPLREARLAALVVERLVRGRSPWLTRSASSSGSFTFGEVAILSRRRQLLPLLEYALERQKIPFTLAGRALFATREAHDVLALLRLLVDSDDRHALATVLRGPAFGASDSTLALLSEPGRGLLSPWAWFSPTAGKDSGSDAGTRLADAGPSFADRLPHAERRRLEEWSERLASLRRIGARLGAGDALRAAIVELDIEAVLAALPRGAQTLGNVDRIVAMADERGGSLHAFTRWLGARIADESDESEAAVTDRDEDAVKLMTIHASKGLEFGAVILVDLAFSPRTMAPGIAMSRAGARPALVVRYKTREGAPLPFPSATMHLDDERGRDRAERRRLTYVALTRAKDLLVLMEPNLDDKKPPLGSALVTLQTFTATSAVTSTSVGTDTSTTIGAPIILGASSWLDISPGTGANAPQRPEASPIAARAPSKDAAPRRTPRRLTLATTPLARFAECPRRYELSELLGLSEPSPVIHAARSTPAALFATAPDPRDLGTLAHAWLERSAVATWGTHLSPSSIAQELRTLAPQELLLGTDGSAVDSVSRHIVRFMGGDYARRAADTGHLGREVAFVLPLETVDPGLSIQGHAAKAETRAISLRGKIDLLVRWPDGTADVIDYKLSRRAADLTPHSFQLRTYALAAMRRFGVRAVRAGIVFLDGSEESTEPVFLDPPPHGIELALFEVTLSELASRAARARWGQHFDPVPLTRCRDLACGFVASCYPNG